MNWQTILMKYHALFLRKSGQISQNLSSAAVVIGALRVNKRIDLKNVVIYWSERD